MNHKGFTLIELILVIAIIALLSLVFTPNVLNLINKNKTDAYNATIDTVISAAENYIANNRYNDVVLNNIKKCDGTGFDIALNTLVDSGDLSKIPKDMCTDELLSNTSVTVTFDCSKKEFSYKFLDKIENCKNK